MELRSSVFEDVRAKRLPRRTSVADDTYCNSHYVNGGGVYYCRRGARDRTDNSMGHVSYNNALVPLPLRYYNSGKKLMYWRLGR